MMLPMPRWLAWLCLGGLAVAASLVLGMCAYTGGMWPQHLDVTVEGPASWRLVRVDDRVQDLLLPASASKYLGIGPSGREVSCEVEISNGVDRARGRIFAWDVGGFVTGHKALPRGVDSLDASLWLLTDGW